MIKATEAYKKAKNNANTETAKSLTLIQLHGVIMTKQQIKQRLTDLITQAIALGDKADITVGDQDVIANQLRAISIESRILSTLLQEATC